MPNPVIIFGAGASHDSISSRVGNAGSGSRQPPLTAGIFENRFDNFLRRYPALASSAAQIRSEIAAGKSLEDFFSLMKISKKPHRIKQAEELSLYLQNIFQYVSGYTVTTDNYGHLINRILDVDMWAGATFITFNYDTLFDNALASAMSVNFSSTGDYIANPYRLAKLHGSWNWELKKGDELDKIEVVSGARGLKDIYPALTIPLSSGKNFFCPDDHLEKAKEALLETENLLIIGWKGEEEHFKKILKECIGKRRINLFIVSTTQKSATVVREKFDFINSHRALDETVFGGGFSHFLNGGDFDKVLSWMQFIS